MTNADQRAILYDALDRAARYAKDLHITQDKFSSMATVAYTSAALKLARAADRVCRCVSREPAAVLRTRPSASPERSRRVSSVFSAVPSSPTGKAPARS